MPRGVAGESSAYIVVAVLFLAAITQQPALLLVAMVLGALVGLTALWQHWCLGNVEYSRVLSQQRAFPGETVDLRIQTVNRKLLPLPWLVVEDELPAELTIHGGRVTPSYKASRLELRMLLSLRWYERVSRRYRVECTARGYHSFGPARLHSGDIFGFFSREAASPEVDHLLVYPRVVPLEELGLPAKQPFGGRRAPRWMLEDPLRVAGVRDYAPGDSLRRIHWKASARTSRLQVKLQDPSTSLDLLLFLNVGTVVPEWRGNVPLLLEEAITVTASLASHYLNAGFPVGLYVNTTVTGSDQQVKLPLAGDPPHLSRILEALAKVSGFATVSIERFLTQEGRALPWGATIVLVSAATPEGALAALLRLRRAGHRVALVQVGDSVVAAGTLPVYRVAVAGEG